MHALARLALTPFLLLAQPAWAQEEPAPSRTLDDEAPVRALLVGVNEYPSLRAHYESIDRLAVYNSRIRLQGPVNDAGRIAEVLRTVLEFPGESIQTMTSGSAVPPTRTNILAGLDRLVEDARSGELVVIFLAGHGDQVPDISGDESDGKDEVFLPEDTSRWNSKEGRIPGSIRDDVLNEKFAAIAATGARVWLIVDACHSGTLFRGGVGDVRYRTLDSELLGIPSDATAASVAPGSVPRRDEASVDADFPGDVIAMYAAEPTQRAQEQGYASGDASVRHGSFTWHLTQQLSRLGGQRSFQELISRVQGAFRSQAIYNQTPVGHGDLSAAIDGSVGDDLSSMQLGVSGQDMVVNAGSIRGLSNGDVLDVFAPFHRGEREHLIGQVRIDEVRPSSAFVVPTDEGGVEFDQVRTADASRLPVEISSASLDVKRIRIAFRNRSGQEIAASDLPEEFRAAFDTERMQRLTAFSSISEADAILELEDPTDPDTAGRFLWSRADLAPVKFESGKAHQVAGRSYRARNLRQLASHSVVGNLPADVVVRLEEEIDGKWVPLPEFARLVPGSRFRVFAKNASETPVQVWVFLFLPDLQIFRALPTGPQLREGAVLRPGAEWERKLRADDAPLGPGALVAMVLSEDAVGIDGLAAEPYDGTRTRGAGMNELLGDLAFGHAEGVRTRGIGVDDEGSLEGVGLLNYDVQYDFGATERPFSLLPAEGESFLGSPDLLVRPTISDSAFARTLTEARLEARERGLSEVYERLAPAVFVVRTRSSHGTGFLIDNEQGLLLTNHHVVSTGWQYSKNGRWLVDLTRGQIDPQTGFMSAEDQELKAEVVHLDERRDLAMLRIVGDHPWLEGHPVLEVGATAPRPGMPCMIMGHPSSGFLWSFRSGEVSQLGRSPHDIVQTMIAQLSANEDVLRQVRTELEQSSSVRTLLSTVGANPGDSGGPLFDLEGNLLAVTHAVPTEVGDKEFTYHVHLSEVRAFLAEAPDLSSPLPTQIPEAFRTGPNVLWHKDQDRSRNAAGSLLQSQISEYEFVSFFDFDNDAQIGESVEPSRLRSALARRDARVLDFEMVVHQGPTEVVVFYDTDQVSGFDLVLADHDDDPMADTRFEIVDGRWVMTADIDEQLIDVGRSMANGGNAFSAAKLVQQALR